MNRRSPVGAIDTVANPGTAAMNLDEDTLREYFGRIWPAHNDAFCELLVTLRRYFGGDLDRMLVLAIIGSRTLARGRIDGMCYDRFMEGERANERAPINLQSIADYSGIPRETVRRKLLDLERSGWITRRNKGDLVITEKAAQDLEPATRATMRYLLSVVSACNEAVYDRASTPAPARRP